MKKYLLLIYLFGIYSCEDKSSESAYDTIHFGAIQVEMVAINRPNPNFRWLRLKQPRGYRNCLRLTWTSFFAFLRNSPGWNFLYVNY